MTTLANHPGPSDVPRVVMSRDEAADQLRLFGWKEKSIRLLLYPTPPSYPFFAGPGDGAGVSITILNEAVRPVRT